jgi:hypothetical protein
MDEKPDAQLTQLSRVRYFTGQLLSPDDFEDEQAYFLGKHRRHNRLLHGEGIVYGLEVSVGAGKVRVEPGFALDGHGREICVPEAAGVQLPTTGSVVYLSIQYAEQEMRPAPAIEATRIEEGFEVVYHPSDPFSRHRRCGPGWWACGEEHAIPLARLRRRRGLAA